MPTSHKLIVHTRPGCKGCGGGINCYDREQPCGRPRWCFGCAQRRGIKSHDDEWQQFVKPLT